MSDLHFTRISPVFFQLYSIELDHKCFPTVKKEPMKVIDKWHQLILRYRWIDVVVIETGINGNKFIIDKSYVQSLSR